MVDEVLKTKTICDIVHNEEANTLRFDFTDNTALLVRVTLKGKLDGFWWKKESVANESTN